MKIIWTQLAVFCAAAGLLAAAEVQFTILDDESGQPMPGRIHLRDARGKEQRPLGYPFWNDHFVFDGTARVSLPNGGYTFTVERGPEFESANGGFEITERKRTVSTRLKRITHLAAEGWWSGETHIHRPMEDVELLMRAEDLHVGQVITWWNATNPWKDGATTANPITAFDRDRYFHALSGEDERDGGALLFCDLSRALDITGGKRHFPASVVYARQARDRGAKWIDAEKPFWWDFPMWLAAGVVDTVGIANNHMNRAGMYENEAWGRPRDVSKYPAPLGNALWTQEIYYHALNCGLRLPPTAGSASGVLANPVGYNRVYVHVDGDFTYQKWKKGLLAGRSFVSNGPLLRCRANEQLPGHVFRTDSPFEITIEGKLDSRDRIKALELVQNGETTRINFPAKIRLESSGWFLVRAIADVTNTFRFASTAPWYVEIANRPASGRKASAEFFVDWCRERMEALRTRDQIGAAQKEQVLQPWNAALNFWRNKRDSFQ